MNADRTVSSGINLEFRDVDKFVSELGGSVVVVTDSWIFQCNIHSVDVIHQRDAVIKYACRCTLLVNTV